MRITPSGDYVTSFSVASNYRSRAQSGESKEDTQWFNCQAWGKLAETCNQYLTKGQQVYVEGRVKLRTYNKQGGGQGHSLDVNVTNVQFLGRRAERDEDGEDVEVNEDALTF
jgi:single-strand DNA-binding protein